MAEQKHPMVTMQVTAAERRIILALRAGRGRVEWVPSKTTAAPAATQGDDHDE